MDFGAFLYLNSLIEKLLNAATPLQQTDVFVWVENNLYSLRYRQMKKAYSTLIITMIRQQIRLQKKLIFNLAS